jgi:DNA uptake protein ComE-like DNA-binding protein
MHQVQTRVGFTRRTLMIGVAAVAGTLVLSACGGSAATSRTTAAAPPAQSASAPAASPATGSVTQKVNANTASVAEMQQAFEAAGISSAARWAREVEEYRPYPTDDPSFAKLRRELAKYNPGPGVVDQIVATLAL